MHPHASFGSGDEEEPAVEDDDDEDDHVDGEEAGIGRE